MIKKARKVELEVDGWIIKARWFGIVVVLTGRRAMITGLSAIGWRVLAEQVAGLTVSRNAPIAQAAWPRQGGEHSWGRMLRLTRATHGRWGGSG